MKYIGKVVGKRHDAHRAFVEGRIYDDRQIAALAAKHGLIVTRPNGDRRYRGSRRLCVVDKKRLVWQFAAHQNENPTFEYPTPVFRV